MTIKYVVHKGKKCREGLWQEGAISKPLERVAQNEGLHSAPLILKNGAFWKIPLYLQYNILLCIQLSIMLFPMRQRKRILVTNIRVSHLAAQDPQVDGKVITCPAEEGKKLVSCSLKQITLNKSNTNYTCLLGHTQKKGYVSFFNNGML